jgi:hypothetical protein
MRAQRSAQRTFERPMPGQMDARDSIFQPKTNRDQNFRSDLKAGSKWLMSRVGQVGLVRRRI